MARGIVLAVRRAVQKEGNPIAVTAKLNMTDGVRGGISVEEALQTAKWLEEDGGLDAIELTAGSSLVNPMYLFRGDAPVKEFASGFKPPMRWGIRMTGKKFLREYPYREAYLLRDAKLFRAELKMPLILLGGITNRETMDLAMAEGFDFVAMGRALLAEPDLINRIKADGDAHSVLSACTHCNKCMATIYSPHPLRGHRLAGLTGYCGFEAGIHRQQRRRPELQHRLGAHVLVRLDDEFLCGDRVGDTVVLCEEGAGHRGFGNDGEHRVVTQSGAAVFVVAVGVHADRDERLFRAAERDRGLWRFAAHLGADEAPVVSGIRRLCRGRRQ